MMPDFEKARNSILEELNKRAKVYPEYSKLREIFDKEITIEAVKNTINEQISDSKIRLRQIEEEKEIYLNNFAFFDAVYRILDRLIRKYPEYEYVLKEIQADVHEDRDMNRYEAERAEEDEEFNKALIEFFRKKFEKAI